MCGCATVTCCRDKPTLRRPVPNNGGLSGRVFPHSWTESAGQLIGCAVRPMLHQTSREAFCDYSNAVLHNERITWAGSLATVFWRQAFWTSPSKRSLTIVPPGQFRPSVVSTITGGLLVGLVLEAQPLGRTTLRTKMLGYTASPTSAVKEGGPTVYRNFPAVDGVMATRLDSQLIIVETEETKQGKDDK